MVICGEDVVKKKPHPEAYLLAMEKMGVQPNICLAIEDSENGLLSARQAGLEVLVVRSQFFSMPSFLVQNLSQMNFLNCIQFFRNSQFN